jgi:hypothetical protein
MGFQLGGLIKGMHGVYAHLAWRIRITLKQSTLATVAAFIAILCVSPPSGEAYLAGSACKQA